MTETVLRSASQEVVIGFERPFVVVGERINPTGRRLLAEELSHGDYSRVEHDVVAQVEAGAHILDVNAGVPMADEASLMANLVKLIQGLTSVPLCLDSSVIGALEAGLAVYDGKALVNSVTGEDERLEAVLPLVKKFGAAVVAISHDESGISNDPDVRFAAAKKIVERAADHGVPAHDVVIDPLCLPVGARSEAALVAFEVIRRLREELKVNMICGASNTSFGLPNRPALNRAFVAMAMGAGLTSAIVNPLQGDLMDTIMASDVLLTHDTKCKRWIKKARQSAAKLAGGGEKRAQSG